MAKQETVREVSLSKAESEESHLGQSLCQAAYDFGDNLIACTALPAQAQIMSGIQSLLECGDRSLLEDFPSVRQSCKFLEPRQTSIVDLTRCLTKGSKLETRPENRLENLRETQLEYGLEARMGKQLVREILFDYSQPKRPGRDTSNKQSPNTDLDSGR